MRKKSKFYQFPKSSTPSHIKLDPPPPLNKKTNHCCYNISCPVLSSLNPSTTPSPSPAAPVLAFCLSGFSPAPHTLRGPPSLTPCYPTSPSPQGKPAAPSPLCFPSLPPSSASSLPLCERPAEGRGEAFPPGERQKPGHKMIQEIRRETRAGSLFILRDVSPK